MRVDGLDSLLAIDNMQDRAVEGTTGWQLVSIVLDVPASAIGISVGVLFSGTGQLLVDDLSLQTVDLTTPKTDLLSGPVPNAYNTAAAASCGTFRIVFVRQRVDCV